MKARSRTEKNQRLVMGRNTVRELLTHDPDRIEVLYAAVEKGASEGQEILHRARGLGIAVQMLSQSQLSEKCESSSHQSFAALVRERAAMGLNDLMVLLESQERALVLLLDSINDPHNLGAILRAAECFGVDAVIWSKNRGASVTAAVSKVSVGASELVRTVEVANLAEAARRLKDSDFWLVGAEARDGATMLPSYEFPRRAALLMGSEGEGLQPLLRKMLDYRVQIPLYGQIDSLNVSQATAVMLYAWRAGLKLP